MYVAIKYNFVRSSVNIDKCCQWKTITWLIAELKLNDVGTGTDVHIYTQPVTANKFDIKLLNLLLRCSMHSFCGNSFICVDFEPTDKLLEHLFIQFPFCCVVSLVICFAFCLISCWRRLSLRFLIQFQIKFLLFLCFVSPK